MDKFSAPRLIIKIIGAILILVIGLVLGNMAYEYYVENYIGDLTAEVEAEVVKIGNIVSVRDPKTGAMDLAEDVWTVEVKYSVDVSDGEEVVSKEFIRNFNVTSESKPYEVSDSIIVTYYIKDPGKLKHN